MTDEAQEPKDPTPEKRYTLEVTDGEKSVLKLEGVYNLLIVAEHDTPDGARNLRVIPSGDPQWDSWAITNLQADLVGGIMQQRMSVAHQNAKPGIIMAGDLPKDLPQ